jgi:RHS repeat-associated protein
VYFTVQPGGAYIETPGRGPKGGWLVYPNYHRQRPRQRVQFFHYDPEEKDWYVYGLGKVSTDAQRVIPDSTTRVYELTGAMINDGNSPPDAWATPGGDRVADPVDPSTGVFVMHKTDLELPDVLPIAVTRVYNSGDDFSRPFGTGMTHAYAMFLWSAKEYQEADLVLPEGGKIHFHRTSTGTGYSDAQFVHRETPALSATPTPFYQAVMSWNGNGWNIRLTDGTVYEFGVNTPLQSITDRYGNKVTVSREFGRYGNITRVTSPHGRWIGFTYDADSHITEATDNAGRTVKYAYDANGNLLTVTGADSAVTTYTYTAANQLATVADARGIVFVSNRYGADRRVVEQTLADPAARYQFAYTQNAAGGIAQTEITDPRGVVERLTFNDDHYVTGQVEAVGLAEERATLFERQPRTNFVTAEVDALGRRTTYAYTNAGNPHTITRLSGTADAVTTTIAYDPLFNQVQSITDPMNHAWTRAYDSGGRVIRTTDPQGISTSFVTDSAGRVTAAANALHETWQFAYSAGDRTSTSNPLGAVWNQFVDDGGRVLTSNDPLGRVARTGYDALNRVTSIVDAAGGETRFTYDANGRVTSLADPLNHATSYEWDANNRLAAKVDALQNAERYEYDVLGNLTSVIDRNGQTTRYEYDPHNRLALVTYADASTTRYAYDAGDRLVLIVDSLGGTIAREYDDLDRLISEATPEGTVAYAYDADGRRTSMTAAGQMPVTYEYDPAHRLTAIVQGGAAVSIGYDAAGRRGIMRLPNGIVATYGYDAAGQIASITYAAGANLVGDLTYTYDAAGNPTSVGGSLASTGMPAEVSASEYDAANRLISWNGQPLLYDGNGNVTSDGPATYTWDARNQLAAIGGALPSAFEYDGVGRRRGRIAGSQTQYLYDGVNVIAELSGGGAVATMLTGGIDEIFQRVDAGGVRSLITDALGSTVALADASVTLSTRYAYDPFGTTKVSGGASSNSAQFTGREAEANGLYFSRARYYDPKRGRFLSEDPIGAFGGPNAYAYVGGMPTRFTDPFGLYNRDVHYDLTRATAEQVGMCAADAEMVAAADQWVDEDRRASPLPPLNVGARRSFHFTDFERRQELRQGAFRTGSRLEMGAYLHALQDSFSHQHGRKDRDGEPYGPIRGHIMDGHTPDNPRDRPFLWRRMARTTANELWQFHQLHPQCGAR